ncbi:MULTISPECIES: TrbI/VirB10 family protein [unclassified Janthinobacterium]|uniref:TrbI/VirB10 family protein n=1 Tax=unclassified Janthinobacterium TaxID=2610881 RepID=UPI00088A42EF|nr:MULTISPECIES: TrbI/VirB10 family protein [unclassified Janthinobacterium]SDA85956.1 conjugal transfer pilus assembly protein TraB [Janthinobacterium sp. 551a]SFB65952.1 conjugal transfer pilus assembly protein TraB [Janthinobacterium sp. 344]
MRIMQTLKSCTARLTPKQQQYLAAAGIVTACIGVLWAVLAYSESGSPAKQLPKATDKRATVNVDGTSMMVPGQISPEDQWVGNAGKKLAQYDSDKEAQDKINNDHKVVEAALLKRLADLEAKTAATAEPAPPPAPPAPVTPPIPQPSGPAPSQYPPGTPLGGNMPPGPPATDVASGNTGVLRPNEPPETPAPMIRVSLGAATDSSRKTGSTGEIGANGGTTANTLEDFLPVGILPGELLGGIDAPTGGQAQSNPLPALIKISAAAILPNQFRADVKECFVVASGYGDISSERAYLRTDVLSCIRYDRSVVEVKIEGNIFGEDGNLGLRGTLVSKQGQLLANSLRAGIVSGIGQGFAQGNSSFTTSPFGTLSTTTSGTGDQFRRGIGSGMGSALNNLANYYIRLAEQTFPVIEVHAGRKVDVVLTRGVRIPARPMSRSDADRQDQLGLAERTMEVPNEDAD